MSQAVRKFTKAMATPTAKSLLTTRQSLQFTTTLIRPVKHGGGLLRTRIGSDSMKRFLLGFVFVAGLCLNVDAANPSFSSFATNQFITNNFLIRVRLNPAQFDTNASSVTITLTNVAGVPGGGTLWTNSAGVLQPLGHIGGTNQFTIAEASGWTGTGTNAFFDDGTFNGVAVINPTDGYIPYRMSAYEFGDSPWYRISTNRLGFTTTNKFFFYDPSFSYLAMGLTSLQNVDFNFANNDTAIGDSALSAITTGAENTAIGVSALASTTTGSENSAIGSTAMALNVSGSDNVAIGNGSGASSTNATDSVFVGHSAFQAGSQSRQNVFIGRRAGDAITGTATNRIAIGYRSQATNDNEIVIGNTNNIAAIFPITSYTGAGTRVLTDDGTYKTVSGAGGLVINPTDNYIPFRTNSTTFLNSPFYVVSTNAAIDSQLIFGPGTTNVLYRSGTDLIYTNGSATPNLTVVKGDGTKVSLRMTTGSHGMIVAGAGSDLYLSSNNNGSGDYVANSGGFLPTSSGARSLGSSSMGFKDLYIAGTTNQIHFGATNTAPVSSAAPTKWISVQVSGESTVYRMPLYE